MQSSEKQSHSEDEQSKIHTDSADKTSKENSERTDHSFRQEEFMNGYIKGYLEGFFQGKALGPDGMYHEIMKSFATDFLKKGVPVEFVAAATRLSPITLGKIAFNIKYANDLLAHGIEEVRALSRSSKYSTYIARYID